MHIKVTLILLIINKFGNIEGLEAVSDTFDFIIVGAGSSGSVIANRLSEISSWNILLLEVGEEESHLSQIPFIAPLLQLSHYNWRYSMEHQPNIALGCEDARMPWPKGRALGGTSVINYMIYTRGHHFDYDKWAAQGNPGWSYADVLPYFKKSEKAVLKNYANYTYHGLNGYLRVEDAYQSRISDAFLEGLMEMGLPLIDYNANTTLGVSTIQSTTLHGKRLSAAQAFLRPISYRNNLKIFTQALATRILINPSNKKAYGVEFEISGVRYKVGASKEVILSAGTFNSPQLLMLSGIGPQTHLEELGIPILKNLKVGENLQDHLAFLGLSFATNLDVTLKFTDLLNLFNYFTFYTGGGGPLSCLGGAQSIAYIKTSSSTEDKMDPDMELLFIGGSLATDYGLFQRRVMGFTDDIYNNVFAPLQISNSFMIFPTLLHPKSKGRLRLRSRDPHDYPLLYGNYLTDPENEDMKSFLSAIRYVQRLSRTRSFQKFNVIFNTNPVPGCKHLQLDSDPYWECCVRFLAQTLHHQLGTAKMGPSGDPDAVVNHELKVHGIERLRVADCSVIPFALGAHTNAPAMMIGEKAADLIKATWLN